MTRSVHCHQKAGPHENTVARKGCGRCDTGNGQRYQFGLLLTLQNSRNDSLDPVAGFRFQPVCRSGRQEHLVDTRELCSELAASQASGEGIAQLRFPLGALPGELYEQARALGFCSGRLDQLLATLAGRLDDAMQQAPLRALQDRRHLKAQTPQIPLIANSLDLLDALMGEGMERDAEESLKSVAELA